MKAFAKYLLAVALAIICFPVLASNYSAEILNWSGTSLVYYGRLTDGSGTSAAADSGPNGLAGLVSGTITFGSTGLVTGSSDTSALWGASGALDLGSAGETFFHNWDYTHPMHVEAIFKPNLNRVNGVQEQAVIFSKASSASPYQGWSVNVAFDDAVSNKTALEFTLSHSITAGQYMQVYCATDLANGTTYALAADYDGSGSVGGMTLSVNGVPCTTMVSASASTLSTSIITAVDPFVGAQQGNANFLKGNLQEVAIWNVSHPAGYQSGMGSATVPGDTIAWYHSNLQQGTGLPVAWNPNVPNVIWDDDITDDIGGTNDVQELIWLHKNRYINLVGIVADTADVNSASVARAILDYWGLQSVPVLAYQGTFFAGNSQGFSSSTTTQFRPQDITNVGISSTLGTVSVAGTNYQVGDVLPIPGGTLANGFSAATLTVTSVSGGGITGLRVSNSGSYSSAPSSPVTLPNNHGGTQAVVAFSTCARRCNYTDPDSGLIDLINRYNNIAYVMGGTASALQPLLQNYHSAVSSQIGALIFISGEAPSCTYWNVCPDYNLHSSPSSYNYVDANWPSNVPIFQFGTENPFAQESNNGGPGCFVYGGPPTIANQTNDPVQWAANHTNGSYFVSGHLRCNWEINAFLFTAFGIKTAGGSPYAQYNYYAANQGTETIDGSTGNNSFSLASGNWSYFRYRASAAQFNALQTTIFADSPANYAGKGLLLNSNF
jgi:hypothetical protein